MYHLLTLPKQSIVYTFVDYMATLDIPIIVENIDEHLVLSVTKKEDIERARIELARFMQEPNHPRYACASWKSEKAAVKLPFQDKLKNKPELIKTGFFTTLIAIIVLILFLLKPILGTPILLDYLGFPLEAFSLTTLWRWITPIFLHFSLLHLLFNLSWWWYLGGMIERELGMFKLVKITLISAIVSNYAEFVFVSPYFGGLSGVVYALMGYVWLIGVFKIKMGVYLDNGIMIVALIWLIAGFTGLIGPIANIAHISGLVCGLLFGLVDRLVSGKTS